MKDTAPHHVPSDDAELINILDKLTAATSIDEVWSLLTIQMEIYGFDRLLYGFTRSHTAQSLGHRKDILVLSNHDPAYLNEFLNTERFRHAPMVQWARENTGAMSWSWIETHADTLTPEQLEAIDINQKHGVTAGYTISFHASISRIKAAIGLTVPVGEDQSKADALWREFGRKINIICQLSHLKITNFPWPEQQRQLSKRQREVLEWVGEGKTVSEIATILGLTNATIEKHLKGAREALGVSTTALALMKAAQHNQMFIVERSE